MVSSCFHVLIRFCLKIKCWSTYRHGKVWKGSSTRRCVGTCVSSQGLQLLDTIHSSLSAFTNDLFCADLKLLHKIILFFLRQSAPRKVTHECSTRHQDKANHALAARHPSLLTMTNFGVVMCGNRCIVFTTVHQFPRRTDERFHHCVDKQ